MRTAGTDGVGLNTPELPEHIALSCPACDTGSLHDGQLQCPSCGFTLEHEDPVAILEHSPVKEDYSDPIDLAVSTKSMEGIPGAFA